MPTVIINDLMQSVYFPPYCPDLAPKHFHVFPKPKEFLGGNKFENDEELKEIVTAYRLAAEQFDNRILKLVKIYKNV